MNTPCPHVKSRPRLLVAFLASLLVAAASACGAANGGNGGMLDECQQPRVEATGMVADNASADTGTNLASVAVPEPSNALIGFVLAAGLLRRRRVNA